MLGYRLDTNTGGWLENLGILWVLDKFKSLELLILDKSFWDLVIDFKKACIFLILNF